MRGISELDELLASHEGLCSTDLVKSHNGPHTTKTYLSEEIGNTVRYWLGLDFRTLSHSLIINFWISTVNEMLRTFLSAEHYYHFYTDMSIIYDAF